MSTFGATEEQAGRAFGKLDTDGSGDLDLTELNGFFKAMDGDGTSYISLVLYFATGSRLKLL